MHTPLPFLLLALFFSISIADELIDDFERGESKNLQGGYWFYFSDVKDGGNSEILNAEMLSMGNYSAPKPVKDSDKPGYCLKLDYRLGDEQPKVETENVGETDHCNFTAIGTDIARPGIISDIHQAYGISFRARSHDSIVVFFELVTSNIYDYGYYRKYFWITDSWKTYQVDFNDKNQFMLPEIGYEYDPEDHQLMLTKVQKMNWQVAACFADARDWNLLENIDEYYQIGEGTFYLDDIILLDSSKVGTNIPVTRRSRIEPDVSKVTGDLLGRKVLPESFKIAPGIYLLPEKKCMKLLNNRPSKW